MRHNDPRLIPVAWWQSESGIILPSEVRDSIPAQMPADLPVELRPNPKPVIFHKPTESSAQLRVFVNEEMVGWPTSSLDDMRAMAGGLSFERAIEGLSVIAARIAGTDSSAAGQFAIAQEILAGTQLLGRVEEALRANPGAHAFAEQNLYAFMQLLLEHGTDVGFEDEVREAEPAIFNRSLLAATAVVDIGVRDLELELAGEESWLPYLIQLSAYYTSPHLLLEVARAQLMLEIASSEIARAMDCFCPIEEWYRKHLGLGAEEQLRLMTALAVKFSAFDGSKTKTHMPAAAFDELLETAGLADRKDETLRLVSANREEYQAEFDDLGEGARRLLWELRPFKKRPLLRAQNGDLILLSPRFLESWFSEGFHYRALDLARLENASSRYLKFAGKLFEIHCLRVAESAYGGSSGIRVHGDRPYTAGESGVTCDVTVDSVTDLVMFEVTNSRLRASTLVNGDAADAREDLERFLVKKCRQLNACIDRVIAREAPFPDEIGSVKRIWPVIVSAGVPIQTPPLWNYLARELPGAFSQARVQPLTILDPEEFELLCGLVEGGRTLPELLAMKTAPAYRHLDLKAWIYDDPQMRGRGRRPTMMEDAFGKVFDRVAEGMNFAESEPGAST
jgi:hypothetical protein